MSLKLHLVYKNNYGKTPSFIIILFFNERHCKTRNRRCSPPGRMTMQLSSTRMMMTCGGLSRNDWKDSNWLLPSFSNNPIQF